ncbi:MAG: leucyl aminopeptidase [Deltaproteobacteria bacterium]|jgi:leucyl aminopeptidase|nr:leucyl aminopeptidase [Deltaproteobacteria bacterium]
MIFKYKCEPFNGPVKPATVVFLPIGPDSIDRTDGLASFRLLIQPHLTSGAFKGQHLEALPLFGSQDTWLVIIGLGPLEKLTEAGLLAAAAQAGQTLNKLRVKEAVVSLPSLAFGSIKTLELICTGFKLSLEPRGEYKSVKSEPQPIIKNITFQTPSASDFIDRSKSVLTRAETLATAQLEARYLTDGPAQEFTPEALAAQAVEAGSTKMFKVTVWDESKLEIEKAGAILAVGRGSVNRPRMVILEYQGAAGLAKDSSTVLIGKGVTFDSGGLCLKPAENMNLMKTDMAGAAAVLAILKAAATLKLPQRLVGLLPLAENMPSGSAYRPGDIVTTMSGQTVEIVNTDAEGRLILADALTLAHKYNPARIIDLATLTGACQVALGERCAGLFCDHPQLLKSLQTAGKDAGEHFWPMPFVEEYEDNLKSDLADFKQAGSRAGGAINAALFLRRFVTKNIPWAHLDIAGTARNTKARPGCPEGATGFGVRTILKMLTEF